jgi:energy-converting hydrogenase A subunit R
MKIMGKDIYLFLDNEGPESKNDNAQESTVALAEQCGLGKEMGIRFFQRMSNIDDIWGDFHKIAKDPTYSPGHTLKVILPFLKAMGATTLWLYKFAQKSLLVVPNIDKVLTILSRKYNVWMISTSYDWFIAAFCDQTGFDFNRAYCTKVDRFDEIPITEEEIILLRRFIEEVSQMPIIEYDKETGEVIPEHQKYYDRITKFVWETVYNMPVGKFLREVHPVGQTQKLEALEQICKEFGIPKEKAMYVGDSQTDVQCVGWLREEGITMMFNGKGRVCQLSSIMYIGEDAKAIKEVVDLFAERGRQGVIDYYTPPREAECGGLLAAVTPENIKELEEMSVRKRKEFRGVHIGELT